MRFLHTAWHDIAMIWGFPASDLKMWFTIFFRERGIYIVTWKKLCRKHLGGANIDGKPMLLFIDRWIERDITSTEYNMERSLRLGFVWLCFHQELEIPNRRWASICCPYEWWPYRRKKSSPDQKTVACLFQASPFFWKGTKLKFQDQDSEISQFPQICWERIFDWKTSAAGASGKSAVLLFSCLDQISCCSITFPETEKL